MKLRSLAATCALLAASFYAGSLWAQKPAIRPLESHIWKATDARHSTGAWGGISIYTEDGEPSCGTASVLTAELEFLPGKQLQPPHQHPDEEFQYVIAGSGTWSLNGKEFPLQTGDLMYSKPGDLHGIRNSGGEPLRFFVFKWRGLESEGTCGK
jgi:mannose-6-phosphate isomerase-like protein (cupin superfamily)